MKLAIICTMYGTPWGGSEELWSKVVDKAMSSGDEVLISAYGWEQVHPKIQTLIDKGAKVHFRKRFVNSTSIIGKVAAKLRKKISSGKEFEHIQLFNPDAICVSQSQTFDVLGNPELFKVLTEGVIPYFLISQFNYEHHVLSASNLVSARTLFKKAKTVFFVSQRNRQVAERQVAASIPNAIIISNPFNLKENKAVSFAGSYILRMACVARLDVMYKGHDLLFQVLAADKWKERSWSLCLYGQGDDAFYLQELIAYYGLADKIQMKGHVNSIQDVWLNNEVLVLPSIGEGTPLSLIEAMICARAAVVTDVGDSATLINEGVNGYVIAAPVPPLIDAALEKLWNSKDRMEEMGKASREIILKKNDFNSGQTLLNYIKATLK